MYGTETHQTYQSVSEEEVRAIKKQVARALNAEVLDEASLFKILEHVDTLLVKATTQHHNIALVLSRVCLSTLRSS